MIAYRHNRFISARNPQMPDSRNQRFAANAAKWESFRRHARATFYSGPPARVARFEREFGKSIDRGGVGVELKAQKGFCYPQTKNFSVVVEAKDENWNGPIRTMPGNSRPGAFSGDTCGPK
jgi:hypothetical protein